MNMIYGNIRIRDFERKDADNLYRIVREDKIRHYMQDWSEEIVTDNNYYEHIDKMQAQKDSLDFIKNKVHACFAIALPETDEMVGMIAAGYKEDLYENEVAYFISEKHLRHGYAENALNGIVKWCFEALPEEELPYLILTANCSNAPSNALAEKCGFELFEKRIPYDSEGREKTDDTYNYYRRYRD